MGNYSQQENVEPITFLSDPEAESVFAKVDYALKNGKHIQRWKEQEDLFRFVDKNYTSLKKYYYSYFKLSLETGGESTQKYFYLEFLPENRTGVPIENRHFLLNEYVIVGFLLYKIIYIDGYIELDSIINLQKIIRQDYEHIKPGIYKALAKAKKINTTKMDDQKLDEAIEKAMREFSKIGWLEMNGQSFEPLPSFQRLPKIYGDYINNLDNWLMEETKS